MKPLRFCMAAILVTLGVILAVSWTSPAGAQPLNYAGQYFQFPHKRMQFVDMFDKDHRRIGGGPMIIDKVRIAGERPTPEEQGRYKKYLLSKTGAFILRFVLQHVDPTIIKTLYVAQFKVTEATATSEINKFLKTLLDYNPPLLVRDFTWSSEEPDTPKITSTSRFSGLGVDVTVGMNQMGGGGFKIPPF